MPPLKPLSKEEAALTPGPYATTVESAISASIAPFLWRERDEKGISRYVMERSSSLYQTDQTFMVAADHIFAAYLEARNRFGDLARCQVGNLRMDPEDRLI